MIKKIRKFISNFDLTFHEHEWKLEGITPMIERKNPDRGDVYKIRCVHCHKKQNRNYFGFMRLYKLGRLREEGRA